MAFTRPTLAEILSRVQTDFISRLELTGAILRRSMVYVLSRVIAGAAHMLHGHLDFLGRQLFPDQSDDAYLVRQAAVFGIAKTAPSFATATCEITGVDTTAIPAGTILVRSDGVTYTTDSIGTIASGVVATNITADVAGADGSLTVGVVLAFESPISGADATTAVTVVLTDGTDQETTEALRVRLLEHLAEPAHGGTEADYIAWAKEVAGVTRVWVSPLELGPGTVVVRFARDNDAGPIPDAGEVAAVQAKLDTEAPVHATVTAHAPADAPVAFTITIVPDTSENRAAVSAELSDLIIREGAPGTTILLSAIRTAIGNTSGLTDYTMTVPVADVTFTTNQLPSLGTITWI